MADVCTVTGTLYNMDGSLGVGRALYIVEVLTTDEAITTEPVQILADPITAQVTFDVIRNSTAWLEGSVEQFDVIGGVPVTIPDAPTATLQSLLPATNAPSTAVTQSTFNAHVATVAAPGVLGHVRGGGNGYTIDPDGTLQVPVVSAEVVEDYLATFFNPTVSALHFTYNDALNRVDVGVDNATASVDGFMSAADKTYLNSVPALLSGEASARAAADTALQSGINANSATIAALTTSGVAEGTNLYFTNARAIAAVGLNAAGAAGGQTVNGGTAASENITIQSTAHATKGYILLGTGGLVGVNKATPGAQLHVNAKDATTLGFVVQMAATPNATTGIPFQVWDSTGATKFSVDTTGSVAAGVNLSMGGRVVLTQYSDKLELGASTPNGISSASSILVRASKMFLFGATNTATTFDPDTSIGRNGAGIVQIGDGGANANGKVYAANFGVGVAPSTFGVDVQSNYGAQLVLGKTGQAGVINFRRGTDGASASFVGYGSAGSGNAFQVSSGGGGGNLVLSAVGTLSLVSGNIWNPLFADTSGNVGIGHVTPTALFHVKQPTAGAGTVSVTAGSGAITGVGTQFLNTFKVGDTITFTTASGSETKAITAIASDTAMTTAAFTGAASGVAYTLTGGDRFIVYGNGNVNIGSFGVTGSYGVQFTPRLINMSRSADGATMITLDSGANKIAAGTIAATQFDVGNTNDTILTRDAVGTLALRNLATAQKFYVYGTTDAGQTNYERGYARWSGNVFQIGTEAGGTGTSRTTNINGAAISFAIAGSNQWVISTAGNLQPNADGAVDLGAAASRIRDAYIGRTLTLNQSAVGSINLVVKAVASQTASQTEWQDSTGAAKLFVDKGFALVANRGTTYAVNSGDMLVANAGASTDRLLTFSLNNTAYWHWNLFGGGTGNLNFVETGVADFRLALRRGGGVAINIDPNSMSATAVFQVDSTTQGWLPPRMTTTQRDAIASPTEGMEIYNLSTHHPNYYNGTAWTAL